MATTDYNNLRTNGRYVATRMPLHFRQSAGETLADAFIFVATHPCKLVGIRAVHIVAGNDAGAVTLQVRKCTGTQAPAAGTALLTNNTNAGFDLKAAANTVQTGALVGTAASLVMAVGDRLALDLTGTPTALAGLTVTGEMEFTDGT